MGIADELERLARLHRDGDLSDEDYAAAKAAALAQSQPATAPTASDAAARPLRLPFEPRMAMGVLGGLAVVSLFMTWVDLLFFRLNAIDAVRFAFGLDALLTDLADLLGDFGEEDAGLGFGVGDRLLVVAALVAFVAMVSAAAWTTPERRSLQAIAGGAPLLLGSLFVIVRLGDALDLLGGGFVLFVLATLAIVVLAVAERRAGPSADGAAPESGRPGIGRARIDVRAALASRRARQALVAVPLVVALVLGGTWVLSPTSASGPIVVEYVVGPFSADTRQPQRDASLRVVASGQESVIPLDADPAGGAGGTVIRLDAGEWRTGEPVRLNYVPSLTQQEARRLRLDVLDEATWFDAPLRSTIDLPEQPTRLSRIRTEELVVRIVITDETAEISLDHDGFGRLLEESLARVDEPDLERRAIAERERQARVEAAVAASCTAIQRSWRQVFGDFNRAEATLFEREWDVGGRRLYSEWARRAGAMRNGLVGPYNATAPSQARVATSAAPVVGGEAEIAALNLRIRSEVASARSAIDAYLNNWDSVRRASQLQNDTLWDRSVRQAHALRRDARSGIRISFGC